MTAPNRSRDDGTTGVTLTRAERDALHAEIELELSGALGDIAASLKAGDGERVRDMRASAERAFRLLDDLGWDRLDARDVYPLTVPADELAGYARSRIAETEGCLRDSAPAVAEISAGGDPWDYLRKQVGISLEDDIADLWRTIDRDLDVLDACRSILSQLVTDAC